jgi:hypothetical protein
MADDGALMTIGKQLRKAGEAVYKQTVGLVVYFSKNLIGIVAEYGFIGLSWLIGEFGILETTAGNLLIGEPLISRGLEIVGFGSFYYLITILYLFAVIVSLIDKFRPDCVQKL